MSNLTNPEAFQFEAATILAAAYSAFPMTINWELDTKGDGYPTEKGDSRDRIQFETVRWLLEHGYIFSRDGFINSDTWRRLGLTEKGLVALNSVPDVLSGKEPLGKRLVAAVGKGSIDIIKQLVPAIIQQAMLGQTDTQSV